MSTFYSKMAQTSSRLLTKFGTDATLTTGGVSVRDKITGSVTKTGSETHSVKAVITDFNTGMKDGETILVGDRKIIMNPTVKPMIGDVITISGSTWNIVDVHSSDPAGIPLVYTLQVRK